MLKTKKIILTGMFVSFIIVCSLIKIPMIPVPISLAFTSINLICLISDTNLSFISVLMYIVLGLAGIPVFSQGGGIGYVLNPTFGYILGFFIMPFISSFFKKIVVYNKEFVKNIIISILNMFTVYICGMIYAVFILKTFYVMSYDIRQFITLFALIFIPGDLLMALITSFLGARLKRIVKIY